MLKTSSAPRIGYDDDKEKDDWKAPKRWLCFLAKLVCVKPLMQTSWRRFGRTQDSQHAQTAQTNPNHPRISMPPSRF
jgi:hypothetical protein